MALTDEAYPDDFYLPILGSSEEDLRRRAARGPLRSGSILGAKNSISPLMNSGASLDERPVLGDRPILGSSVTPRPKLIALNGDGSPYARMTEASSPRGITERARNTPILGNRDGQPSDGILGRGVESRPRVPDASADTTLPEAPILGASTASPSPAGGLGILGAQQAPRLGFKERQALPTTSAGTPAGSAAFYQNAIERIEDQKANPWGSPENHPGTLGKIGHILGRVGNIAGDITGYTANIPGTDLNRQLRESRLEDRFETASNRENRAAETEEQRRIEERRNEVLDRRNDVLDRKNDILEGKQPKQTPDEAAIADLQKRINPDTGRPYTAYEARVKLAQDIQDTKPAGHTSPFEAFAFGTPKEKKAAQDFLAFEKRMGAQYQKPTEAEFRYGLYRRDPEGYKAVFGDKAAAGDRAHAAKMLNFFQKQRNEISKDFMIGDDEKAQKLAEIDEMEQPFKDAAAMGGAGGSGDRVNVTAPDGTPGTIPRSQLGAAKRKGYRVAQ